MLRSSVGFLVVATIALAACSGGDDAGGADETTTTATSTSTSAELPATTVVTSPGSVTIGDDTYVLDVTCIAPGVGEVLAVGIGEAADGTRVEAYVQAFLGEPYVGVEIGDTLLESAFDGSLDLYLQDDAIRASAIRFVTDLDLETGEATFVGLGSVEIECIEYDEELPPTAFG